MVDDPITEHVRKNTQIVSDAAYKGVHPHIVEMDRRPGIIVGKLLSVVVTVKHCGEDKSPCLCSPDFIFSFFSA